MLFNIVHGITGLTLPTNLTSMGVYCFSDCTELTGELFLPDGLDKVNDYAFNNCKLQQLTFTSDSLITSFNQYCFYSNKLSWIGYITTTNRTNTDSTLPPKTITINANAFMSCKNLINLILPNSIVKIGEYAFSSCTLLDIVSWSTSLYSVGANAFSNTSITSLPIGDKLKVIENRCFGKCLNLPNMDIITEYLEQSSIIRIDGSPFYNCTQFTGNYNGIIINKNEDIINISNQAFYGTSVTKEMTIPDDITSIADSAYASTTSFTNTYLDTDGNIVLEIPSTVTSIGVSAFEGSSAFTKVIIPKSVTSIGEYAFANCSKLENIEFQSDSVIKILPEYFASGSKLKDCILPENLEKISSHAFYSNHIEKINLPSTLKEIGSHAFAWNTSLKSVVIPSNVVLIDKKAFCYTALEKIELPDSVKSLGEAAFSYSCSENPTIVIFGTGITSIPDSCFDSKYNSNYKGIGSITCNGNITSIGSKAFYDQTNLTSINGITWSNLKSIGSSAFENCTSLSGSISLSSTCSVSDNAFENCLLSVGRINK
jgi:hypothetical protein